MREQNYSQFTLAKKIRQYLLSQEAEGAAVPININEVEKGICFGLSLCLNEMHLLGKSDWWTNTLKILMNWDETKGSLNTTFTPKDLPGLEQETTLNKLFERAINYIIYYQSGYIFKEQINVYSALSQWTSYCLDKEKTQKNSDRIALKNYALSWNFTTSQLESMLDKKNISGNPILILNETHACTLIWDEQKSEYLFYDPNYSTGEPNSFKNLTDAIKEIHSLLGTNLSLHFRSREENALKIEKYYKSIIKESNLKNIPEIIKNLLCYYNPKYLIEINPDRIKSIFDANQISILIASALSEATLEGKDAQLTSTFKYLQTHYQAYFCSDVFEKIVSLSLNNTENKTADKLLKLSENALLTTRLHLSLTMGKYAEFINFLYKKVENGDKLYPDGLNTKQARDNLSLINIIQTLDHENGSQLMDFFSTNTHCFSKADQISVIESLIINAFQNQNFDILTKINSINDNAIKKLAVDYSAATLKLNPSITTKLNQEQNFLLYHFLIQNQQSINPLLFNNLISTIEKNALKCKDISSLIELSSNSDPCLKKNLASYLNTVLTNNPNLVNNTQANGEIPLWRAIEVGADEIAEVLIDRGADFEYIAYGHHSPIQLANILGRTDVLNHIRKSYKINTVDVTDFDILIKHAIKERHFGIIHHVFNELTKSGQHEAIRKYTHQIVHSLNYDLIIQLSHVFGYRAPSEFFYNLESERVDFHELLTKTNQDGATLLMQAVENDDAALVSYLLDKRSCSPWQIGENKYSDENTFSLCIKNNNINLFKLICEKKNIYCYSVLYDINTKNEAFFMELYKGNEKVKNGSSHITPLLSILESKTKFTNIIEKIIIEGENLELTNHNGETAFRLAIKNQDFNTAELILEKAISSENQVLLKACLEDIHKIYTPSSKIPDKEHNLLTTLLNYYEKKYKFLRGNGIFKTNFINSNTYKNATSKQKISLIHEKVFDLNKRSRTQDVFNQRTKKSASALVKTSLFSKSPARQTRPAYRNQPILPRPS